MDPEIDSAFAGSTPLPQAQASSGDPEIEAAFAKGVSSPNVPPSLWYQMEGGYEKYVKPYVDKFLNPPQPDIYSYPGAHNLPPRQTPTDLAKSAGDALQGFAVRHNASPYVAAALGELPELGKDVAQAELSGPALAHSAGELSSEVPSFAEEEAAETERLADIHARAESQGFDIPETASPERLAKASSTNQGLADNTIRQNFNLSPQAPLTPEMMDGWRSRFAANSTFAEARAVPEVQLSEEAVDSLDALPAAMKKYLRLDDVISADNTISGDEAVNLSQALRGESSSYWKSAKLNPGDKYQARGIDAAVDNVENSVGGYLKDPQQWALDRAKIAQSYDVQSALDSGHVDVGDLSRIKYSKNQIQPWSGPINDLASLGNLHPDAFSLTRTPLPRYSLLRKGLAYGAGAAAGAAAAKAGLGALSHVVGQSAANAITPP